MTSVDDETIRSPSVDLDPAEREALERATAQLVERLSLLDSTPHGTPRMAARLLASEVRWTDGTWASCLAEVEDWLGLEEELPFHSRDLLGRVVARALRFGATADAFQGNPSGLVLSDAGIERLHALLEQALYRHHRSLEIENVLEEDVEALAAEETEEDEIDVEPTYEPIAAKASVWNINEFSDRALRGKLNLSPSYQRADVWPTADAQLLVESVLRGIPLPSVIVLKPQGDSGSPYEVVDGKQRLTSILRFIGAHPDAVRKVRDLGRANDIDLLTPFQRDYPRFRSLWKSLTGEVLTAATEKELYFPFRLSSASTALRGGLERLRGKYYSEIRDQLVEVAEEQLEIGELFERVTEYKIPVIEYFRATHTQIHEVFNLYNKQGKHLNAEEIRNALFHDLDLMRGILVGSGDSSDVEAVAPFLVERRDLVETLGTSMTALGFGTVRYRRSKVLSWVASLLVDDSRDESGRPRRLSTAGQINSFLRRVQRDDQDPLRDTSRLQDLFTLLSSSTTVVERESDAWAPGFKGGSAEARWQELPLIGTLVGVAAAGAVLEEGLGERLRAIRYDLHRATASDPVWQRPNKTQTATQWAYIAAIALNTIRLLGVEPHEASLALRRRFGQSGIQALIAIESMRR